MGTGNLSEPIPPSGAPKFRPFVTEVLYELKKFALGDESAGERKGSNRQLESRPLVVETEVGTFRTVIQLWHADVIGATGDISVRKGWNDYPGLSAR